MRNIYYHTSKAPIGCNDCHGCDTCCHEMGDSIIQDPYDLWNFSTHMKVSGGAPITFDLLISEDGPWELSTHEHMLLPNIKMVDDGVCPFLSESGRCSIHSIRSGLCRLYPLGRQYEARGDQEILTYYILEETLGCPKIANGGTPVLISEWLGLPHPDKYQKFLLDWHSIKNDMYVFYQMMSQDNYLRMQNLLLHIFFENNYERDFYNDFNNRMQVWQGVKSAALS